MTTRISIAEVLSFTLAAPVVRGLVAERNVGRRGGAALAGRFRFAVDVGLWRRCARRGLRVPLQYLCHLAILPGHMAVSPTSAKTKPASQPLTVSRPELLVNGSDAEFRAVVHGMLAFAARLQGIRERFGALVGLTGIQYTSLISICHLESDGGVTVGAVADHLHLSGAFITIETGKLVRLGLITKVQDFSDRRRVCLRVTRGARTLAGGTAALEVKKAVRTRR